MGPLSVVSHGSHGNTFPHSMTCFKIKMRELFLQLL